MSLWIRFLYAHSKDLLESILWTKMEEEKKTELEETETVPIEEKVETIHFPWFMAIVMGALMLIIIGLFIAIKIIEG